MSHRDWLTLADTIGIVCPQLDFLSYVLSVEPDGLSPKDAGGLASILAAISEQLKQAAKEDADDNP